MYKPWTEMVTLDYSSLHWREADRLLERVVEAIPDRLASLESLSQATPQGGNWKADFSDDSFAALGLWVPEVVVGNRLKDDEITIEVNDQLRASVQAHVRRAIIEHGVWEFDNYSEAVLYDIGLYMGERIHRDVPTTRWIRCKNKSDSEFNMPLLGMVKNGGFQPLLIPHNTANRIINENFESSGFLTVLRRWIENARRTESKRVDTWWKDR